MNLVGEKGQKQDKAGLLWVPADYELSSSHQASQSGADVIQKPPLKKQKRSFWSESSVVKGLWELHEAR